MKNEEIQRQVDGRLRGGNTLIIKKTHREAASGGSHAPPLTRERDRSRSEL